MHWWQSGIVYQIYARSFQDSDGDGTGDLRGITARLPDLVWLGIDAVWITPVYPSPMADFGYDVADYCGIDPLFGTLQDFDALLAEAHRLGLRVIMDFVPNHSSDQHPWFQSSRDPASPHADWYIWRPGSNDRWPNNWTANFGGPAWTWDERRQACYYHSFLPQQPDLDWRNPAVAAAMHDVLRFWLDRGVDGFRVDVMWMIIKDDQFRDNPPNPAWQPGQPSTDRLIPLYNTDRPEVHQVVAGLRSVLDQYPGRVLIGELYLPTARLVTYYGQHGEGAQLPFNFQLLLLQDWTAQAIATLIRDYEAALPPGAWPNWVLGNHDRPRIATRIGPAQARIAAMLLLTLRGTPTIYMGEELGLQDTPIPPDAIRDPAERRQPGHGLGRDPERTPYPWTAAPGAGFTSGTPWLPIGPAIPQDHQATDETSMLSLYRRLIALRRHHPALVEGTITNVTATGPILSYDRQSGPDHLRIVLNTAHTPMWVDARGTILAGTLAQRDSQPITRPVELLPDEGLVICPETPGQI